MQSWLCLWKAEAVLWMWVTFVSRLNVSESVAVCGSQGAFCSHWQNDLKLITFADYSIEQSFQFNKQWKGSPPPLKFTVALQQAGRALLASASLTFVYQVACVQWWSDSKHSSSQLLALCTVISGIFLVLTLILVAVWNLVVDDCSYRRVIFVCQHLAYSTIALIGYFEKMASYVCAMLKDTKLKHIPLEMLANENCMSLFARV